MVGAGANCSRGRGRSSGRLTGSCRENRGKNIKQSDGVFLKVPSSVREDRPYMHVIHTLISDMGQSIRVSMLIALIRLMAHCQMESATSVRILHILHFVHPWTRGARDCHYCVFSAPSSDDQHCTGWTSKSQFVHALLGVRGRQANHSTRPPCKGSIRRSMGMWSGRRSYLGWCWTLWFTSELSWRQSRACTSLTGAASQILLLSGLLYLLCGIWHIQLQAAACFAGAAARVFQAGYAGFLWDSSVELFGSGSGGGGNYTGDNPSSLGLTSFLWSVLEGLENSKGWVDHNEWQVGTL